MSLTPGDREVLEAYQATEQARSHMDPDPLDPSDIDLAYAEGWTDGQDDVARRRPRSVPITLVIEVVAFTFGIGFIFGLVFASAVHAAPRPPAVIPPTGSPAVQADQLATGVPSARALGGAPSPSVGVPSPRPSGGIGRPLCSSSPCPTATPRPTPSSKPLRPRSTRSGIASWFDSYGSGLYGAVHSWRFGDRRYPVAVCAGSRCVTVTIRDFCACPGRLIDLSRDAFARLAEPSRGLIRVTVEGIR